MKIDRYKFFFDNICKFDLFVLSLSGNNNLNKNIMALQINYDKQEQIKSALEMAISYCNDNIATTDSWSKEGLLKHKQTFENLLKNIGSSYVIADDPS